LADGFLAFVVCSRKAADEATSRNGNINKVTLSWISEEGSKEQEGNTAVVLCPAKTAHHHQGEKGGQSESPDMISARTGLLVTSLGS
jgi:hypothetical protein